MQEFEALAHLARPDERILAKARVEARTHDNEAVLDCVGFVDVLTTTGIGHTGSLCELGSDARARLNR